VILTQKWRKKTKITVKVLRGGIKRFANFQLKRSKVVLVVIQSFVMPGAERRTLVITDPAAG